MTSGDGDEELFDAPARWRLQAVETLGLQGEDRIAGLATGAAYPDALTPVVAVLAGGDGTVLDVGAGLGATSQWLAAQAGRRVVAVEPEEVSATSSRRAFPGFPVAIGTSGALPVAAGRCGAVTFLGVVSLVEDLGPVLAEAERVLGASGLLAISDLCCPPGRGPLELGPNVFRSVEALTEALGTIGLVTREVWWAPDDLTTAWAETSARVDDEMARRHRGTPELATWHEDQQRLGEAVRDGLVRAATVVAARR